ncbi:cache domain-containing protein [Arthrobacter mobilis]|uniref:Cache domain-containing protein n=1 Tax=Arthrobacter mobilis TaxID=2724944 RepID=A0A7X6HG61_9MICC|nr:cache domain-containing protein [Arthrobacter mobilis]NKX55416.1 hypothetical protein [Arthrobacter mobilis]
MNPGSRTENITPAAVVAVVETCASGIFDLLRGASEEFVRELQTRPAPRVAEAIHQLELACRGRLAGPGPLTGMGFVGAPEQDLSEALRLIWWIKQGKEIRVKKHVLNPASDSYYDYNTSEWFGTTRATGRPFISAPYVDSWGTDQLTITAAVPLAVHGVFIGVVAADLDPALYLKPIEKLLLRSENLTLVDAEDRVILSSNPVLTSGVSLERYLQRTGIEPLRRETSSSTNWQAVELP